MGEDDLVSERLKSFSNHLAHSWALTRWKKIGGVHHYFQPWRIEVVQQLASFLGGGHDIRNLRFDGHGHARLFGNAESPFYGVKQIVPRSLCMVLRVSGPHVFRVPSACAKGDNICSKFRSRLGQHAQPLKPNPTLIEVRM